MKHNSKPAQSVRPSRMHEGRYDAWRHVSAVLGAKVLSPVFVPLSNRKIVWRNAVAPRGA